jgi:ABC-type lipoprotein export system ATPase subunit/predicted  nucleic acid-binding Zn-ribbon protein
MKWDLHIHTPATTLNNEFRVESGKDDWDEYLKMIEADQNVVVLGITDYFGMQGYNEIIEKKNSGRIPNIELILLNCELRIIPVTSTDTPINFHFIFSTEIINELERRFFSQLKFEYQGDNYNCTRDELIRLGRIYRNDSRLQETPAYKVGVEQFKVNLSDLKKLLKDDPILKENCITAVANSNVDGASGIQHSSLAATRQEIYRFADVILSSNPNDRLYFLGKGADSKEEILRKFGSLKACIHGSDAHSLERVVNPDLRRFTWIKSDPTFSGFRQVLFEPEERVRIQESNPKYDFRKSSFKKLSLSKNQILRNGLVHFTQNEIPLNQNLVAIIGGRGTGKSLLLDVIAKTFGKTKRNERIAQINDQLDFLISYSKTDDTVIDFSLSALNNELDYLHVHQSEIKEVVKNPDLLDKQIKMMLNITEQPIEESFDTKSESLINSIFNAIEWNQQTDDDDNFINSISFNTGQKLKIEGLVNTLTTETYKARIEQYIDNTNKINEAEESEKKISALRKELEEFEININNSIQDINDGVEEANVIPKVGFEPHYNIIDKRIETLTTDIEKLKELNKQISEDFIGIGISEDISTLLQKISGYQKDIKFFDSNIKEAEKKKTRLTKDIEDLSMLYLDLIKILKEMKNSINESWNSLKRGKEGWTEKQIELLNRLLSEISIEAALKFDVEKFYNLIQPCLYGNRFKATKTESSIERIKNTICVKSLYGYIHLISNKPIIRIEDELIKLSDFINMDYFNYGGDKEFLQKLYLSMHRNDYLKVLAEIKYKDKFPNQISVGQRGTMFICLQLATDPFIKPFVYDQPEDDLDNNFIMSDLVPIFREIKSYRQVIIVTHNANLVVNADAEQIIVANNDNEVISYVAGSLEHNFKPILTENDPLLRQGIREHVCDILEGGEEAFEKREQKYGFA